MYKISKNIYFSVYLKGNIETNVTKISQCRLFLSHSNNFSSRTKNVFTESREMIKKPHEFEFRSKPDSVNQQNQKARKITPMGWFLLLIPVTTFGLGCWQVQRKKWKESLIKELEKQTSCDPVDLPDDLFDLESMEYRPVKVTGEFLHNYELRLGPRSLLQKNESTKGGLFTQKDSSIGYHIITPFKLEGREEIILINRGWVSRTHCEPKSRLDGQITGTVDLVGVVRKGEQRAQFQPKSVGKIFAYRDLSEMCRLTGANPIFLDAAATSTVKGGPIGGQTRITLRNEHLSYIFTWFSLSGITAFLWYRQIVKRIPF